MGRGLGDYLAEAAHLEAAAIVAFDQIARSLVSFGAPESLVRKMEKAKADEVRHARVLKRLALEHGCTPKEVDVVVEHEHDLESLAIENAIEGCVRETFSALRAIWQAKHAEDRRIRAAFAVIAEEEAAHAELSWELADWLETRLDHAARARVQLAREQALAELGLELTIEPHPDVHREAGMPSVRTSLRLLEEMVSRLSLSEAA